MQHLRSKRIRLSALFWVFLTAVLTAADVQEIQPGREPTLSGKELDWIYGDYLMTNDQISIVIAAPLKTRDANMTVGLCDIDPGS